MKQLSKEPEAQLRDVSQLIGLSMAMEKTAAQRCQRLTAHMERLN
jgi:hypothetical protein